MSQEIGKVFLVGAGPGDPRLLTLRGKQCLEAADVVLYDYLASADLLCFVKPNAEQICLGRHGQGRLMSQDDVNRLMVERALAGRTVVRLKGGDPGIFGRLAEETESLQLAGVQYEIVPGVTAAVAAGAYAGVTLTHRGHTSSVAFVTGREQDGKSLEESLDYESLAQFPGTLVFYMGVTTAPAWSQALIDHGKPGDTPVVFVRHCSLPTQVSSTCQLDEVADRFASLRPPLIAIVGQVSKDHELADWFTTRLLFGQKVLVTRPAHQANAMAQPFLELGAEVLYQPAIEIGPPRDWDPVDRAITQLNEFDWLVFSSRNGVEFFLRRLREQSHDWRALAHLKLAAIGPATAQALAEWYLDVDLHAEQYRAEALAGELAPLAKGQRFLLLRASRGREVLADSLCEAGAKVEQVAAYESRDVTAADPTIAKAMATGAIDWTTASSSSTARSLVHLFGESLKQTKLVAISPLTGRVLTELGYPPAAVATEYNTEGVVDAILQAIGGT